MNMKRILLIVAALLVPAVPSAAWAQQINAASSATDNSGTITTGGTFQTLAPSSLTRKSLEFTNVCGIGSNCVAKTDNCYLYIAGSGSGSTANSVIVSPGQMYLRSSGAIPSNAISGTCDGNGDHYALKVQ